MEGAMRPWDPLMGKGASIFFLIWHNISIEIGGLDIKMLRDDEQSHGHHVVIRGLVVGAGSISNPCIITVVT